MNRRRHLDPHECDGRRDGSTRCQELCVLAKARFGLRSFRVEGVMTMTVWKRAQYWHSGPEQEILVGFNQSGCFNLLTRRNYWQSFYSSSATVQTFVTKATDASPK